MGDNEGIGGHPNKLIEQVGKCVHFVGELVPGDYY